MRRKSSIMKYFIEHLSGSYFIDAGNAFKKSDVNGLKIQFVYQFFIIDVFFFSY